MPENSSYQIEIDQLFEEYYRDWYEGVLDPTWGKDCQYKGYFDPGEAKKTLNKIESLVSLQDKKILDVGAGFGNLLIAARLSGYDAYGVEPDAIMFQGATKRLKGLGISEDILTNTVGESLPFEDESFDVAIFSTVLEHVQNIYAVLSETARIIKPGGNIIIINPNYALLYEPHYSLFLPVFLPKPFLRFYLWARGRSTPFLDSLNFTTHWSFQKIFKQLPVKCIDYGLEEWEGRILGTNEYPEPPNTLKLLKIIRSLGLSRFFILLGRGGFRTPLIYKLFKD